MTISDLDGNEATFIVSWVDARLGRRRRTRGGGYEIPTEDELFAEARQKLAELVETKRSKDYPNLEHQLRGYAKECSDVEEVLAEALGYHYTPEYGWDIGDHTPTTLAMAAAKKLKELNGDHIELREDK